MKKIFSIVVFILLLIGVVPQITEAVESNEKTFIFEPILVEASKIKTKDTEADITKNILLLISD